MKRILLIGIIISSFAFANSSMMKTGTNNSSMDMKEMKMCTTTKTSLTEAEQKELTSIKESGKKATAPLILTIEEKDIAIKKELLNNKPDWTKIEGLTKEKTSINAQKELIMLKTNNEIKTKFGITQECDHIDMGNMMDMHNDMKSNMKM